MATLLRKQTPLLVLAAIALVLAVWGAGCDTDDSATPDGRDRADLGAGGNGGDGPSLLKFSQCMRGEGFSWFPDPDMGGNLNANEPKGLDRAKYERAQKACEKYAPWGGDSRDETSPDDLAKARKLSQCMRSHGFPTFPDPDQNGDITLGKSSGISPSDPAFQKAQGECQKFAPSP